MGQGLTLSEVVAFHSASIERIKSSNSRIIEAEFAGAEE
jgi:hypothetical protein